MQGIYEIINLTTGDSYVGRSVNIGQRWKGHVLALQGKRHDNGNLQVAWDEYGEGAFSFCVLELVKNEADLQEREQYYLDHAFEVGGTYNIAGDANALPCSRGLQLTEQEMAHCQELAQEAIEECGTYYASAKQLGDSNLRAGLWLLLKKDRPPSERLYQALLAWENRPIILKVRPGSIVIDEEGIMGRPEQIGSILVLPLDEVLPHLRNCAKCGQQMVKWSPGQKYCTRCRKEV